MTTEPLNVRLQNIYEQLFTAVDEVEAQVEALAEEAKRLRDADKLVRKVCKKIASRGDTYISIDLVLAALDPEVTA